MAPQAVSIQPSADEPGPDVVVEYLVRGRSSWGMRLHANGRADEWTAAGGWQPLVQADPAEVAALVNMAARDGYLALPEIVGPADAPDDGTQLSWMIEVDGSRHHVTARGAGPSWDPVLRALDAELQLIVGRALNRVADAPPARQSSGT